MDREAPGTLPFLGHGLVFLRPRQQLFVWFTRCIQQYGHETLRIAIPTLPPGVIIADPVNLDYVFKHEEMFEKGQFFRRRLQDLFGYGIVNVDGDLWKRQRAAGTQFFNATTLRNLARIDLPRVLKRSILHIDANVDSRMAIDLEAVIHEATTQLMSRVAYGVEMHADDDFTRAFDHASGEIAKRFQNPFWRFTELVTGMKLRQSVRIMKSYGQNLVAQAVARRNGRNDTGVGKGYDEGPSLIDKLLNCLGDEALVADSALNYLSAGKDTIAQALTWTFYLLTKHKDVAEKVFGLVNSDIARSFPDNGWTTTTKQQDLGPEATHFILAVFYEALRLYPPIPFEMKQAQQDTILPDGTFIPQKSVVLWCTWAMNRSAKTWGSDAEKYRPERWLHNGKIMQRSTSEYPVFQGGARLCLGKKMAELIAVQVIAALTRSFMFVPAFQGEKTSRTHLTMPMRDGFQVMVKRRPREAGGLGYGKAMVDR
ncbi:cytochrome P450 [Ilyonectria destructans]|nr:cytochrome P450 [Ilyonectria destructans]